MHDCNDDPDTNCRFCMITVGGLGHGGGKDEVVPGEDVTAVTGRESSAELADVALLDGTVKGDNVPALEIIGLAPFGTELALEAELGAPAKLDIPKGGEYAELGVDASPGTLIMEDDGLEDATSEVGPLPAAIPGVELVEVVSTPTELSFTVAGLDKVLETRPTEEELEIVLGNKMLELELAYGVDTPVPLLETPGGPVDVLTGRVEEYVAGTESEEALGPLKFEATDAIEEPAEAVVELEPEAMFEFEKLDIRAVVLLDIGTVGMADVADEADEVNGIDMGELIALVTAELEMTAPDVAVLATADDPDVLGGKEDTFDVVTGEEVEMLGAITPLGEVVVKPR
ncbi:MAG: hypothetical protein M1821_005173 [Bathelium mastoideum]|nr:MAG: hypothetical protein M1821_005173 [Bathelium mastoideum]